MREIRMLDVITVGETCAVFVARDVGRMRYCKDFTIRPGGAESTVAVGVQRLGLNAGWISSVGEDELGHFVKSLIAGEGVDVSRVVTLKGKPTGVFVRERLPEGNARHYYYRNGSAFSALSADMLDEKYIGSAKVLHVTGISPALSDGTASMIWRAVAIAKEAGVKVCFDPNVRLNLWKKEKAVQVLEGFFAAADIVLPGYEDMQMLYGDSSVTAVLKRLKELGCNNFVLKNSHESVFACEEGNVSEIPVKEIKHPVDVMGAGDAFAAGFITGIVEGKSISAAASFGVAVAGLSVQMPGNIESLPTRAEVDRLLSGERTWNR